MAIERKLKPIQAKDTVVILGSGGAARAIASEIRKRTPRITIANKTVKEAKELANRLSPSKHIRFMRLRDKDIIKEIMDSRYIINATSVGMSPNTAESPIDLSGFEGLNSLKGKYFFDAIFNPYETEMLLAAKKRGAKTCSGMYMMIFQAVCALEKWIGKKVELSDLEKINSTLSDYLKG